ncbi:ABC transporter substrate-binding protein [Methylocaldum szegediense]|uniref:NitT/TauT family transport system substrate-binding protein n=1 Tax=Methylocaldum szegediense TaxID=73780 RepID=A0ABN8WWB3_9GAMM|nr:ABC transporter substrate-binding protein [Methylocaldum szegediense]CAI8719317.1 NitT/TauT family transport system substrate-binding protein [Methylocaldum szegediense]
MKSVIGLFVLLILIGPAQAAPSGSTIRIGMLAFGTLNWELAVIQEEGLDKAQGIAVETMPLASSEAGKIALQGGSVDLIVSDWIWVANQRGQNADVTFLPYSTSHGALVVPADSPIRNIGDLKGKRLGIAGGGLDKNWLLLRALAQKEYGLDLERSAEKVFGAPPLLNQQLQQGKLDAVLNYWNFAAKLEAQGYRRIIDGRGILQGLGIEDDVPSLGYVFREDWAKSHEDALSAFLKASDTAKKSICESDAVWRKIVPLTQETDERIQNHLRHHYCDGRIKNWGETEKKAAAEIYELLHRYGGERLTGKSGILPDGVFWH